MRIVPSVFASVSLPFVVVASLSIRQNVRRHRDVHNRLSRVDQTEQNHRCVILMSSARVELQLSKASDYLTAWYIQTPPRALPWKRPHLSKQCGHFNWTVNQTLLKGVKVHFLTPLSQHIERFCNLWTRLWASVDFLNAVWWVLSDMKPDCSAVDPSVPFYIIITHELLPEV